MGYGPFVGVRKEQGGGVTLQENLVILLMDEILHHHVRTVNFKD